MLAVIYSAKLDLEFTLTAPIMFEPTSNLSHHGTNSASYIFRSSSQPNIQGISYADITLLSQKLDTAEKKVIEYALLSKFFTFRQTSLVNH
jgi:hypothetical protein